jgi:hypothetical protein
MCSGSAGVAAAGAGGARDRCGGGGIPDALIGRDIWRVAQLIVKGYGKDAAIQPRHARRRVAGRGRRQNGAATWQEIIRAIEELLRATPREGEAVD